MIKGSWKLKMRFGVESKHGGGICSSVRYIAQVSYCIALTFFYAYNGSFVTTAPHPRGIAGTLTFRSENPCHKFHTAGTNRTSLKNIVVCCLPTQNFQTGSVGRNNFFFCSLSKKKTLLILRLYCL